MVAVDTESSAFVLFDNKNIMEVNKDETDNDNELNNYFKENDKLLEEKSILQKELNEYKAILYKLVDLGKVNADEAIKTNKKLDDAYALLEEGIITF